MRLFYTSSLMQFWLWFMSLCVLTAASFLIYFIIERRKYLFFLTLLPPDWPTGSHVHDTHTHTHTVKVYGPTTIYSTIHIQAHLPKARKATSALQEGRSTCLFPAEFTTVTAFCKYLCTLGWSDLCWIPPQKFPRHTIIPSLPSHASLLLF